MSEYDLICKNLDDLAIDILKTLQGILLERKFLDLNLKEGYIDLAKSRYLMRGRKVGILQVNTNNLIASRKVFSCYDIAGSTKYLTYSSDCFELNDNHSGLRYRGTGDAELAENMKHVSIDDSKTEDSNESSSDSKSIVATDPLKWFGVLVPESLKASQSYFKQATNSALKLCSLQNKLKALGVEYKNIRRKKELLNLNESKTEA